MERNSILALALLTSGAWGCASSLEVAPETRLASAVQVLATESQSFKARRQELVRTRRALLGDEQRDTALLRSDLEQRRVIWELVDDKDRLAAYERILAATRRSAEAWAAYERLAREQGDAVAAADTRFALSEETLNRIVKTLITLGTPTSLEDQARFYAKFLVDTKGAVDEALREAGKAGVATAVEARDKLRATIAKEIEARPLADAPAVAQPDP